MAKSKFTPEVCECCGQAKTYRLGLDKGSAKIVLALIHAIARKGVNEIHPSREIDLSGKKQWYLTNLSRPRFHGLIAYVDKKNKAGYYCITRKGGAFLRGESVPKHAVISKVTGHQEGYWKPDEHQTSLVQLLKEPVTWEGDTRQMIDLIYSKNDDAQSSMF